MDWTKNSTDPCDGATQRLVSEHLNAIREIQHEEYIDWLLKEVEGKSCLDIGAIEHDLSYTEKPTWKHAKVVDKSRRTVGIDIHEDSAKVLNQRGYDIRICDATSDEYLGEKFDIVIIGDVIEHVTSPIALLNFSLRHLNDTGIVVVKTPNPYYYDNIKKFAKEKDFINLEHLAWFTPTMALEIARRSECQLKSYIIFPDDKKGVLGMLFNNEELFSRDYVYVFAHN